MAKNSELDKSEVDIDFVPVMTYNPPKKDNLLEFVSTFILQGGTNERVWSRR